MMEVLEIYEATTHAVPSPNTHYIASLTSSHLNIHYTRDLSVAASFTLPNLRSPSPTTRSSSTTLSSTSDIYWSPDSLSLLLISPSGVSVFGLADTNAHTRIGNGSGGLGRIAAAEVFGNNVIVVWEFGRVGVCEMSRGRVVEVGELKTGIGGLRNTWGIRRVEGKVEVLALLSRTTAQDSLSLYLPNATTPHISITLQTTDAQSLQWSPDGNWISILDSPLSSPGSSIHIYTADGNFFRNWPQPSDTTDDPTELGPHRQCWSPHHLALANSNGSTTLLNTRTFTPETTLDMSIPPASIYTETLTSRNDRTWKFSSSSGSTHQTSEVKEMKFNKDGTLLAIRMETTPDTITIWRINTTFDKANDPEIENDAPTILRSHTPIRKLLWHPKAPSGVLLLHSEDNNLALWDAETENAPLCLTHPFSGNVTVNSDGYPATSTGSGYLSATTTTALPTSVPTQISTSILAASFLPTNPISLLLSTRRRGWCVAYPFGVPPVVDDAVETEETGGIGTPSKKVGDVDDSEDSLYDILSGRTPLPALSIRDVEGEEVDGDGDDDRLEDTFRGKGMVESFEY